MIEDAPAKELERLLAVVDILEPLPPEEVERLALLSSSMRLEAGEAVALDENRETLLLLAGGRVRVHEPTTEGQDLTISIPHLGGPALIAMGFAFLPTPGPGFTEIHVAAFAQQRSRFECPGFDSCPAARQLSEGVPHRAGGLVAHRGQVVGVGVEGHGYGGVSEELLHDLGVDAAA